MFDWFKPEQRVLRRKVQLDRKCLEAGARRFLRSYLSADHGGSHNSIKQLKKRPETAARRRGPY